jgi:hypothetical protein
MTESVNISPPATSTGRLKIRRYRRAEAAAYLREQHGLPCTKKTLSNLNSIGKGPKPEYYGSVPIYREDELDRWAEAVVTPDSPRTVKLRERRAEREAAAAEKEWAAKVRALAGKKPAPKASRKPPPKPARRSR